jgi:hypothetical protein
MRMYSIVLRPAGAWVGPNVQNYHPLSAVGKYQKGVAFRKFDYAQLQLGPPGGAITDTPADSASDEAANFKIGVLSCSAGARAYAASAARGGAAGRTATALHWPTVLLGPSASLQYMLPRTHSFPAARSCSASLSAALLLGKPRTSSAPLCPVSLQGLLHAASNRFCASAPSTAGA